MPRETAMPLDHAYDALNDCVMQFHNHMLQQSVRQLSPRQWVEEFRLWLDPYSFERDYEETTRELAEFDARNRAQSDDPEDNATKGEAEDA